MFIREAIGNIGSTISDTVSETVVPFVSSLMFAPKKSAEADTKALYEKAKLTGFHTAPGKALLHKTMNEGENAYAALAAWRLAEQEEKATYISAIGDESTLHTMLCHQTTYLEMAIKKNRLIGAYAYSVIEGNSALKSQIMMSNYLHNQNHQLHGIYNAMFNQLVDSNPHSLITLRQEHPNAEEYLKDLNKKVNHAERRLNDLNNKGNPNYNNFDSRAKNMMDVLDRREAEEAAHKPKLAR